MKDGRIDGRTAPQSGEALPDSCDEASRDPQASLNADNAARNVQNPNEKMEGALPMAKLSEVPTDPEDAVATPVAQSPEAKRALRMRRIMALKQKEKANLAQVLPHVPGREAKKPAAFSELPTASLKPRHWLVLLSFLLIVAMPVTATVWYLWGRAADQYASYVGFLVRSEQNNTALDALSGLTQLAKNSGSDTDILYKFIQSQSLVEEVSKQIDLAEIWSKHPEDVLFNYNGSRKIEDLVQHWNRMVKIYYDTGMLDLKILAYDPADAKRIADAILSESQKRLDQINAVARQDSMKYAQEDLDLAIARLKEARQAVSAFRNKNQIIDPSSATMEQAGIVATLQQQLAEALVQLDMLRVNAPVGDPRIVQSELRVSSIRDQIKEQRNKVGSDQIEAEALAEIVSQFEALQVDRQFAEASYTAAMAAYDSARSSADRRALYLAAYVQPTLATKSEYPMRLRILAVVSGFLLLVWILGVMFYYGSRDRRR